MLSKYDRKERWLGEYQDKRFWEIFIKGLRDYKFQPTLTQREQKCGFELGLDGGKYFEN